MWAGLLLSLIAKDPVTIVIASGSVAFCSLVAWIVLLARRFPFFFGPLFYFLVFGAVCIITFVKAEKFVKMRAETAARAAVHCTRCGYAIPRGAVFCPMCGTPNAAMQYAPPVQPPYVAQPQYAPPAQPYAPPGQPQYAPPAQPAAPAAEPAEEPAAPAEEDKKKCFSCGAELPAGAVYCGKCGMKQ
jgi:ribosomal protein L40E